MAVRITREERFGSGTRAFHFANVQDPVADDAIYSAGLERERSLLQAESLGRKIFERLSESRSTAEPTVLEKA